jgi:hypothetical protein
MKNTIHRLEALEITAAAMQKKRQIQKQSHYAKIITTGHVLKCEHYIRNNDVKSLTLSVDTLFGVLLEGLDITPNEFDVCAFLDSRFTMYGGVQLNEGDEHLNMR